MISLTSESRTPWHRIPAGPKLALMCVATLGLFGLQNLAVLALCLGFVAGLYLLCGLRFAVNGVKLLKPLIFFFVIILGWHVWSGTPEIGARLLLRVLAAVGFANLVTMTTRLDEMLDVLHRISLPLRKLGISTRPAEIAVAMVIRFIPVLAEKSTALGESWRSRSARRPGWRIVMPLAVLAIDDAEQVSEALRARGGGAAASD